MFVRMTCDLESYIVAVERVKEYAECPQEVHLFYFFVLSLKFCVFQFVVYLNLNICRKYLIVLDITYICVLKLNKRVQHFYI